MTWIKELTTEQVEAALGDLWEALSQQGALALSKPEHPVTGNVWLDCGTGKINVYIGNSWETYSKD